MKEKLEACFLRLQELDIKPTLSNMESLLQTLYDLRWIYNELKARENDVTEDRTAADPDGRNSD